MTQDDPVPRSGQAHSAPRLYEDLSEWWPLLSAPADYEEEAALYMDVMIEHAERPVETVLDLGSGGGNNASHMKSRVAMTLVDLSPGMVAVSRELNPECEHHVGDMRSVRLDRSFDAVFIHDSIDYMASESDLAAALATGAAHLSPGGVMLVCPDHIAETFEPSADHGGHDSPDGRRGLRYLEWTRDPDPTDGLYTVDYAYLARDGDDVGIIHDRHICGLFPRDTWLRLMSGAGLQAVTDVALAGSDWSTVGFCGVAQPTPRVSAAWPGGTRARPGLVPLPGLRR
ncbi:MAG: class I SAM-dependent DNA methyltransferase [Actinomycetota bacterium]